MIDPNDAPDGYDAWELRPNELGERVWVFLGAFTAPAGTKRSDLINFVSVI